MSMNQLLESIRAIADKIALNILKAIVKLDALSVLVALLSLKKKMPSSDTLEQSAYLTSYIKLKPVLLLY